MTTRADTPGNCSYQANPDSTAVKAQLDLFIFLGNMNDLAAGEEFACVLNLGNAIISGEIRAVQTALSAYENRSAALFKHVEYLRRAFAHTSVVFQDPSIIKYEGSLGRIKSVMVLSIMLEHAGKIAFVSSDKSQASFVHNFRRNHLGVMTMDPANEDPALLLKQIGRMVRIPDLLSAPPPPIHSTAEVPR